MDELKQRYFFGDTLEQAVMRAASHFNLHPDEVDFQRVEKRHGFLRVRRRVVIEVDPDRPRRDRIGEPDPLRSAPPTVAEVPGGAARGGRRRGGRGRGEGGQRSAASANGNRAEGASAGHRRGDVNGNRAEAGSGERGRGDGRRGEGRRGGGRGASERGGERSGERGGRRPGGQRAAGEAGRHPAESGAAAAAGEGTTAAATGSGGRRRRGGRGRGGRRRSEDRMVDLGEAPRRAVDRFPAATGAMAEAATSALEELLGLAALDLEFAVLQGEERLEVELWGADEDRATEQFGRVLHALEHLLPRLVRGETGEAMPFRVDCANYQEIREEQLRDLAQRTASEVARNGRSRTLAPMRPDERRIVHMTLVDDPHVVTESQGQGLLKRVQIRPA